jgi:hypothetical protein
MCRHCGNRRHPGSRGRLVLRPLGDGVAPALSLGSAPCFRNEPPVSDQPVAGWDGPEEELLDVRRAAALLTVKPSTLSYWAREGRVPFIDLGPRHHRWTRPLLREIVAERLANGRR